MNWIQNDNQNIDGVDQHPKAWRSLLHLQWLTFYSITLHSFDAVLTGGSYCCFGFFFTCFFFLFCPEDVYYRPYKITMQTDSWSTRIAQIYLDFFQVLLKYT